MEHIYTTHHKDGHTIYELNFKTHPALQEQVTSFPPQLKVGDMIMIKASENPSTGFSWYHDDPHAAPEALKTKYEDKIFKIIEEDHIAANVPAGFCGAPGMKEVLIEAVKPGSDKFQMIYVRPLMAKFDTDNLASIENHGFIEIPIQITQ